MKTGADDEKSIEMRIEEYQTMYNRYKILNKGNKYDYRLFWKCGITFSELLYLIAKQSGKCRVCDVPLSFGRGSSSICVDHDHRCCPSKRCCGKCIKGILCSHCNKLLGFSYNDVNILRKAILYLENYYVRKSEG